jgi:hypothetical protein
VRLSANVFQPPNWSASSGKVKTVQSSETKPKAEVRIEAEPEPQYQAPPAPRVPVEPPQTVEFADMDALLTSGEIYTMETEQDIRMHRPSNDYSGALNARDALPEDEWPSLESFEEPPPDVTDSQQIKRGGLLGRFGTNQGTGDDHGVS